MLPKATESPYELIARSELCSVSTLFLSSQAFLTKTKSHDCHASIASFPLTYHNVDALQTSYAAAVATNVD